MAEYVARYPAVLRSYIWDTRIGIAVGVNRE